jgi:hypothetical protein
VSARFQRFQAVFSGTTRENPETPKPAWHRGCRLGNTTGPAGLEPATPGFGDP